MTTYFVTFHYTVAVEANDQERADELAWEQFAEHLPTISAGDFVSSEPEPLWWEEIA